jgi:hypothetical protein
VRTILAVLLFLASSAAGAQSRDLAPEQAYIAARERVIAELSKMSDSKKEEEDSRLLRGLEPLLRQAIGPFAIPKGFGGDIKPSPDTLCCGAGDGMLDSLIVWGQSQRLVVTTEGLLRYWLQTHKDWWKDDPIPTDPEQAFRSDAFLSLATASDWRVTPLAALAIVKPAGASVAIAVLVMENQGNLLGPPREIAVSVIKGGKVSIAVVKATATDAPIAIRGAIYDDYKIKAEAAGGTVTLQLQEQAQAAFDKCWAERAKGDHAFPALTKEAQDLADRLAAG